MKAHWVAAFGEDLLELKEKPSVVGIQVHRRGSEDWVGAPSSLSAELSKALTATGPLKLGKQKKYLFSVPDVDLVVEIEFDVYPKSPKLRGIADSIHKIREASRHKFDAHHDALTGCKNRKSFDMSMAAALDAMRSKTSVASSSLATPPASSVTLVTLDIDYFKRVNDGYGHDYGDVVLKAFAWALEDACEKASKEMRGASFQLFRLGGEEFNILVVGEIEERDVLAWLESVRLELQNSFVPSDMQLSVIERDMGATIRAPREGDRRVTASFGVSRLSGFIDSAAIGDVASRLKTQADKALYSAKQSGRNRVRFFPDVLKFYGRIIRNDAPAGTVVIDIGSEVGVVVGREFFVVPEKYTGEVPFVVDDGRSQRTLGKFPRLRIAKIVAFDVQPEISFCSVTERRDGTQLAEGSLLEAIPLGLFGGLAGYHSDLGSAGDSDGLRVLKERLLADQDKPFALIAVRLSAIREVEKQYGQVKANGLLAATSSAIGRVVPAPSKIVQVEPGQFGVLFDPDRAPLADIAMKLSVALRSVAGEMTDIFIGAIDSDILAKVNEPPFALQREYSYDYALIAAAAGGKGSWSVFSSSVPMVVLGVHDAAGEHEKVVADYKKLRAIGISSAEIENVAGVAYFAASEDLATASTLFRAALDLDDAQPIFRSNYAIAQFLLKNFSDSYEQMSECARLSGGVVSEELRGLHAVVAYESNKKSGVPSVDKVRSLLLEAKAASNAIFVEEQRLQNLYLEFGI